MIEQFSRLVEQVMGRSSGPLHLRLILQPIVATFLAVRAGRKDAQAGSPPYLWHIFTNPAERTKLIQSGWKDIAKLFAMAFTLDTLYQLIALGMYYPLQSVLMAIILAIIPYCLIRGPVTRFFR